MRDLLLAQKCDVVVFGNSRGFSSDVFITDTARILGIPTVTELLNLYLDLAVLPDVVVGPSTYAVRHHSVQSVVDKVKFLQNSSDNWIDRSFLPLAPISVQVIAPSVDSFGKFDRTLYSATPADSKFGGCNGLVVRHGHDGIRAEEAGSDHRPCFAVGFMARLAPGTCCCRELCVTCLMSQLC